MNDEYKTKPVLQSTLHYIDCTTVMFAFYTHETRNDVDWRSDQIIQSIVRVLKILGEFLHVADIAAL